MAGQTCPTCGASVAIVSSGGNTSYVEPASRTSILCPLCHQRTTHVVCAHCALTTAEERDAARAEVARLTAQLADPDLVERLAAIAHESWAGWIPWMIDKWDDTHASGETFRDRWLRQASTLYANLSEAEKESDRIEARKYLAILKEASTDVSST